MSLTSSSKRTQRAEHCLYCFLRYNDLTSSKTLCQSFCVRDRCKYNISGFGCLDDLTGISGNGRSGGGEGCIGYSTPNLEGCSVRGMSRPMIYSPACSAYDCSVC